VARLLAGMAARQSLAARLSTLAVFQALARMAWPVARMATTLKLFAADATTRGSAAMTRHIVQRHAAAVAFARYKV